MNDYFKRAWEWYSTLSLPMRLILGGLLSGIGGSGLIGFLSEYATYSYSLYYGIRPPFEGVPFLRAAVTSITFVLFLGSATVFIIALLFIRALALYGLVLILVTIAYAQIASKIIKIFNTFSKWSPPTAREFLDKYIKSLSFRKVLIICALICVPVIMTSLSEQGEGPIYAAAVSTMIILIIIVNWRPVVARQLAVVGTVIFFIGLPLLFFHPPSFAEVLRVMGYGGGFPVEIGLLSDEGYINEGPAGYLIIRTSSSLLLFTDDRRILEIPLKSVGTITHNDDALLKKSNWKLPSPIADKYPGKILSLPK